MASERKQLGRATGLGSVRQGKPMEEEEQQVALARQGQGTAKRQLAPTAIQAGPAGGVRTLRSRGGLRQSAAQATLGRGRGLGNRSLNRFRRP